MIHKIVQTIQETVEMSHPSLCTRLNESTSLAEDEQFHETVELEEKDQNSTGFVFKAQAET